jgi:hypothetical protein
MQHISPDSHLSLTVAGGARLIMTVKVPASAAMNTPRTALAPKSDFFVIFSALRMPQVKLPDSSEFTPNSSSIIMHH